MNQEIRTIKSKINLLNAQIAQLHDSGLFSPSEISELTAPLVCQVKDLKEQINPIKPSVNDAEVLTTPQTVQ